MGCKCNSPLNPDTEIRGILMNKITYEEKLKIVKEIQEGYEQIYLSRKYGVPRDLIRSWINSYEILGDEGLKKA